LPQATSGMYAQPLLLVGSPTKNFRAMLTADVRVQGEQAICASGADLRHTSCMSGSAWRSAARGSMLAQSVAHNSDV
jgi:hypothetical protein